jgi:hypothetical protein
MTTINESTSVIAVKTRQLTTGQSTIVYVSSSSDIGQLTTVFDVQGFLSAPQSILVSTTTGVDLGLGLSSIRIQQRFGYATLRSESSTRWSIVNENAFRNPAFDYTIQGLQFSSLNASEMMIISSISTTDVRTGVIKATSGALFGPLFISSLNTGGGGQQTFLVNNMSNSGNYFVQSSLSVNQAASILSTLSTVGPVTIQNNLSVGGAMVARSTMYIMSSLSTTQRILANSNLTVQGLVTTSSNLQCFTSANTSTTVAHQVSARIVVTNNILFDAAQLHTGPDASLYISSSLAVPNTVQTSTLIVNNISTPTITVSSTMFTPSLYLPNATIRNTGGSVTISSIQTNAIQYNTLYGSNATSTIFSISTQAALFSSLFINDGLHASDINIRTGYIDSVYSDYILVDSIASGGDAGLNLVTVSISTITISSMFSASSMSSFTMAADFRASQIVTGVANMGRTVTTSSLSGVVAINDSGSITFSTPGIYTSSIAANTVSTVVGTTSSLTISNATVGPILYADAGAPYCVQSTFSGMSTNTPSEYINGTGAPFFPFHVVAINDSDVGAYISSGPRVAYLTMNYSYSTTAPSTPGTTSIILKNPIVQSTLVTLSSTTAPSFQTYSLSNYQIDTKVISSIYTYNLFGPMTYALPDSTQSQQTLVAGAASLTLAYSSDGGSNWVTLPYVGFETAAYGIAFGGSKWIAVGEGTTNTMIVSYTGTVWYNLGMDVFSVRGLGVAWNGVLWVATGEGTNTLATSSDGITWTGLGTAIFSVRGNGVTWSGSLWLALGQGTNTLATSTDGITWTGQGTTIFSVAAYAAAYNGSLWVAVGEGTDTLATSSDGITWTGHGTTVFQTSGRAIAWNGVNWVAGSDTQPYVPIGYSTDGILWIRISCPLTAVYSVVWSGGQWVASGTGSPAFATSPTGLTWTASTTGLSVTAYTIASRTTYTGTTSPSLIVAVGTGANFLVTSPNGITWTPRTSPFTTVANCVAWNGTLWVAGGSGSYQIAYSYNGIAWTGVIITNMTSISGVSWGKGKWIAVGMGSGGYTRAESSDGINWTSYPFSSGNFFQATANGITWAQGLWIAVGSPQGSGILFSLDGVNWIPQFTSIFTTGRCVSSNGTVFLAGGFGGSTRMAYSLEGSVWQSVQSNPFTTQVNGIAWGSGVWVATGQGTNTLAYSYDGFTWFGLGTSIFGTAGFGVTWTGSLWVATGQGTNSLATSLDGITWKGLGTSYFSIGRGAAAAPIFQPNTITSIEGPVGIRWDSSNVAILSPSVIEKPARTNPGYDAWARSKDGYTTSAFLQFSANQLTGSCYIGLTTGTTPLSAISYAFSLTDTGNVEIWEGGVQVGNFGPYVISDTFQIIFNGTKFSYQKNSVELLSFLRGSGSPLFLEVQFNLGGTRLRNLEFHPLNQITNSASPTTANQFYTTSLPSGFLSPPVSFQRPIVETKFSPSLWQFAIPMSGTLTNPSTSLYADVFLSTSRLFSTAALQVALTPSPSTYTLSYTLSTNVTTTPGDTLDVRIYTQHAQGTVSMYSTTLTNSVYNLSSVQFVELVHNTYGTGAQTSDFSLWVKNDTAPCGNYVNSNSGIEMNSGLLRWNGRQYGLAIQNQYNDMQTRSMTYTGALYTASDSNLKHDIEYADTGALYETMKSLPLHRYSFIGSYRERFRTEDARQLGVLTTEVAARLPSMIKTVDSEFVSDLQTVDRTQFRYAHLGATQHIMARLSTLRGKILGRQ